MLYIDILYLLTLKRTCHPKRCPPHIFPIKKKLGSPGCRLKDPPSKLGPAACHDAHGDWEISTWMFRWNLGSMVCKWVKKTLIYPSYKDDISDFTNQ